MDTDLKKYLQQNNQLTWKEKIQIIYDIINALDKIHKEGAIHRDLHSGNILYSSRTYHWYISDFQFCDLTNKSLKSIYGKLIYLAPEVISKKEFTKESDIYSIGILMCEILSGELTFDYDSNYDLAIKITNGKRPKIISEIPLEYKRLKKEN